MEAEDVKVVLLLSEVSRTNSSSSSSSIASVVVTEWVISVKWFAPLNVVCSSFSKNASTSLPFCKCSFRVHFSVSSRTNLQKEMVWQKN